MQGIVDVCLKFTDTSVPSALEMVHDNALYKFNIDIDIDICLKRRINDYKLLCYRTFVTGDVLFAGRHINICSCGVTVFF